MKNILRKIVRFVTGNKNITSDNGLNEIYFDNGRGSLKERYHKKNPTGRKGWKDGLYQSWHKNGQMESELYYEMGDEVIKELNSKSRYWDKDGKDVTELVHNEKRERKQKERNMMMSSFGKPNFDDAGRLESSWNNWVNNSVGAKHKRADSREEVKKSKKKTTSSANSNSLSGDQKMLVLMYKTLKGVDYSGVRFDASGSSPEQFLASDIDGSWYYSQAQIIMIFKAFSNETFNDALQDLLNANKIKLEDEAPIPGGIRSWNGNGFRIENPPQLNGANMIIITNTELTVKKN